MSNFLEVVVSMVFILIVILIYNTLDKKKESKKDPELPKEWFVETVSNNNDNATELIFKNVLDQVIRHNREVEHKKHEDQRKINEALMERLNSSSYYHNPTLYNQSLYKGCNHRIPTASSHENSK